MRVIITEKPSVAKDIAKVFSIKNRHDGYIEQNGVYITWAFGHLVELMEPDGYDPKFKQWKMSDLPLIPPQFKTQLVRNDGSQKQFNIIKQLLNDEKLEEVICATDAGREGELIFRHIYTQSECRAPIRRLWISSQTDAAIKKGFSNLKDGKEYTPLYESALCRSEADWLIGINATRAYTVKYSSGNGVMSVGRVQTPVLKMIADRYIEHTEFKSTTYYEISVDIAHPNGKFSGKWFHEKEDRLSDKAEAEAIFQTIKDTKNGEIKQMTRKEITEKQPLLYDLTELQKEANRKFSYSADETLKIMQILYERHKILSYPRTSSRYLSKDIVPTLKPLIKNLTDHPDYKEIAQSLYNQDLNITSRIVDDKKVTDHHAIIPTDKKANLAELSKEEKHIFDLVIKRFLSVFLPVCIKDRTEIISKFGADTFKTSGTIIRETGWREIYSDAKPKLDKGKEKENLLPKVNQGDAITQDNAKLDKKQTKPPPLHNDSSILGAMETAGKNIEDETLKEAMKDCGLGTAATRAQIIERLIRVKYIQREKKTLVPTDKGIAILSYIQDKELLSPELTGAWEKKLNDMAQGQYKRDHYMKEIREFTEKIILNIKRSTITVSPPKELILAPCPSCEKGSVIETKRAFSCSMWKENDCKFAIWKQVAGREVSKTIAKALLSTGKTKKLKGFKSKAGKPFEAILELKGARVVFNFNFGPESAA